MLRVFIHAPDVNCPRVSWSLDIDHYIEPKELKPDAPKIERMLNIELGDLILDIRDWRRLAGLEIRGDPSGMMRRNSSVPMAIAIIMRT